MAGHAAHDRYESYMPMELLAEWTDKDPLKRLENALLQELAIDESRLESIRNRVRDETKEAVERADDDEYADRQGGPHRRVRRAGLGGRSIHG